MNIFYHINLFPARFACFSFILAKNDDYGLQKKLKYGIDIISQIKIVLMGNNALFQ